MRVGDAKRPKPDNMIVSGVAPQAAGANGSFSSLPLAFGRWPDDITWHVVSIW